MLLGSLPSRCGTEAAAECDLCACENGYVKDPKTRKCVQYETGCDRRCSYNGRTYAVSCLSVATCTFEIACFMF